jgi:TetR/AcrR family transcriptional repressor of nem operon
MTAKSDQKERTHEEILESAARLLRLRGIAGMSVAEVMRAIGLTVGGFYAHFENKDALVEEAIRRAGRELRQRLLAGVEEKEPAERVDLMLRRYLSRIHREDIEGGCPFPAIVGEVITSNAHRDALAEEVATLADAIEAHHPLVTSVPRRQRALAAIALMFGGLSLARALSGTSLSDEVLKASRAYGRAAMRGFLAAEHESSG